MRRRWTLGVLAVLVVLGLGLAVFGPDVLARFGAGLVALVATGALMAVVTEGERDQP